MKEILPSTPLCSFGAGVRIPSAFAITCRQIWPLVRKFACAAHKVWKLLNHAKIPCDLGIYIDGDFFIQTLLDFMMKVLKSGKCFLYPATINVGLHLIQSTDLNACIL